MKKVETLEEIPVSKYLEDMANFQNHYHRFIKTRLGINRESSKYKRQQTAWVTEEIKKHENEKIKTSVTGKKTKKRYEKYK